MEKNQNNYYVYEWIRLDTNEPFYVGKGCKNRWRSLDNRNKWFKNIVKKIPCVVNILHDNLDEDIANDLEVWYIREYRDIIGYDMVNIADGGEGTALFGKDNPMYGKNPRDYMTEDARIEHDKKQRESMKGKNKGKRHTEEAKKKMSENHADVSGENNPNYGIRRYGKDNYNAKSVICLTTKKIFYSTTEGAKYYDCHDSSICNCCKGKYKSSGKLEDGTKLVWMYLSDFLNKCKYITL